MKSSNFSESKVFIKNWGDIEERLDPPFYLNITLLRRNVIQPSPHPIKALKEKVNMQRGRFGHRPRNDSRYYNGAYPFIQTGNVVKASESNEKIQYSQTLNELGLSTSRLFKERVLVITIAANIGYTAILDYPACFPDSLVALSVKDSEMTIDYLNIYLRLIRRYVEKLAPQAAQRNINLKQLGSLPVIVPKKVVQQAVVIKMNDAYDKKNRMLKEAQRLQDSVENYLLNEFDIALISNKVKSQEKRGFSVEWKAIVGKRFDPYYHSPFFDSNINNILNGKYQTVSLKTIAGAIVKGMMPDESRYADKCKVIQINSINSNGTVDVSKYVLTGKEYPQRLKLNKGDIIFVITGATIGKVGFWDYEGDYYLGGDMVKFNVGNAALNEIYAALFRTEPYQLLIKRCVTGATNGHLAPKDIERFPVPVITDEKVKKQISKRLYEIREDVKSLKKAAKDIVEKAEEEVGRILIGGKG